MTTLDGSYLRQAEKSDMFETYFDKESFRGNRSTLW